MDKQELNNIKKMTEIRRVETVTLTVKQLSEILDLALKGLDEWQPIETCPKDTYVLFYYAQQGDEMPHGLMVGIGQIYSDNGKLWIINTWDNEKAWPCFWKPMPAPPKEGGERCCLQ